MLLVVNYHYIGDETKFKHGIYPVSREKLYVQLKELKKNFVFVGQNEVIAAVHQEKALPPKACLVTFDDGLRCQYELALPVLDELKIPAIFFVNAFPYLHHQALIVHKVHWCQAQMTPEDFLAMVKENFEKLSGQKFSFSHFENLENLAKKQYPFDIIQVGCIKFLLNRDLLSSELRSGIINSIFNSLETNESRFVDAFYLSKDSMRDLGQRGFLGFHGYTHHSLALLSDEKLEEDFEIGMRVIKNIVGEKTHLKSISYPHGEADNDVSERVFQLAKKFGLEIGFTMRRSINQTLTEPLNLSRFDCNDLPGGKQPKFALKDNQIIFS